jgi:exopolysaccharide biosynthesis polyprenyl glycosylphosphotransferase
MLGTRLNSTKGTARSELANTGGKSALPFELFQEHGSDQWRQAISRSTIAPSGRWVQIGYVVADVLLVCINAAVVFYFRFVADPLVGLPHFRPSAVPGDLPLKEYVGFLLLYAALTLLFCQSQDLYRTRRNRSGLDESLAVGKAVVLSTILLTAFIYLSGVKTISRLVVGFSGVLNLATLVAWRLWKRRMVMRRVMQGPSARNVLIVGAGKVGRALARHFEENKQLGYAFKGFLDQNNDGDTRMLGKIEDLSQVAREQFVDEVFITIPSERELVKSVAVAARRQRLNVKVVPELYDGLGWNAPFEYVGDFPVRILHREPIPALGLLVKRMMDVFASALGLILLAPILATIALAVKLESPGLALYRSPRVGKKGRKFICYKFRTMVSNADALKGELRHRNERNGPFFKISSDPRITRLGRWLRKYSLDEVPQLWNVFKGDMSLVGPRPHPLDDYEQYDLEHLRRLDVRPGITGLWQVTARQDPSFETNMALDLEYIEHWDLWLDIKILLRTIPAALSGTGI